MDPLRSDGVTFVIRADLSLDKANGVHGHASRRVEDVSAYRGLAGSARCVLVSHSSCCWNFNRFV